MFIALKLKRVKGLAWLCYKEPSKVALYKTLMLKLEQGKEPGMFWPVFPETSL